MIKELICNETIHLIKGDDTDEEVVEHFIGVDEIFKDTVKL